MLSTGAKCWHFLCLWQPSVSECFTAPLEAGRSSAEPRVHGPLANPVVYITDWKPERLLLFSLACHEKMLCFLCASCFYLLIEKGEYLGVSTKEMTPSTILSAGKHDSWNACPSAAGILPAKQPWLPPLLPRLWQALHVDTMQCCKKQGSI